MKTTRDIFNDKVVLITGASSGIGREFALLFARAGARLILTGRNEDRLALTKGEATKHCRGECHIFRADLCRREGLRGLTAFVQKAGLRVDVLVNNAGFATYGYFHDLDAAEEMDEVALNISAVVYLTRYFLPAMVSRKEGWILNVASTAALLPACPFQAVYGASKAFIASFSLALSEEYRDKNIRISCLIPGNTNTRFWQRGHLKQRYGAQRASMASAQDVAQFGLDLLSRGKDIGVFKAKTAMLSWLIKFLPRRIITRIVYRRHYGKEIADLNNDYRG